MKYLVTREFLDRYTRVEHKKGDIYETENINRARYLQSRGCLGEQVGEEVEVEGMEQEAEETEEPETEELEEEIEEIEVEETKAEPEPEPEPETTEQEPSQIEHVGGGWYKLPDGTRIQGKEAAEKACEDPAGMDGDD